MTHKCTLSRYANALSVQACADNFLGQAMQQDICKHHCKLHENDQIIQAVSSQLEHLHAECTRAAKLQMHV